MAIDMRQWLVEMGVPVANIDATLASMGDVSTVAEKVEKATLRQSDYSRNMNDLQAKQTALEANQKKLDDANERLNQEMVEWGQVQAEGGKVTEKMRRDMATAQAEVTRLTTIVTTKATELGLDPKEIIGETPVVTPPAGGGRTQPPDLEGYVRVEDVNTRLGNMGDYLMTLPTEVMVIVNEHKQLTGEDLDPRTIVQEVKTRATDKMNRNADGTFKKPLDARAVWEGMHDIPTKRAAKAEEARQAEIKAAEQRGYERRTSEDAIPGAQPVGRHSPVLRQAGNAQEHGSRAPRPSGQARQDHVSKAASALATHKYRTGQPAAGT
jgi:hypothetical protein